MLDNFGGSEIISVLESIVPTASFFAIASIIPFKSTAFLHYPNNKNVLQFSQNKGFPSGNKCPEGKPSLLQFFFTAAFCNFLLQFPFKPLIPFYNT
jgi:hypothetical protein